MAEYIFTNLPQYVKINSRSEFSSSVVSSGAILLFTEDGYTLTGKLPDGTFITIGGSSGTDVSDTTATAATVLGGYDFYDSAGSKTTGTIPTVSAALSGNLIIVPSGYIAASQTFNVSGGIDVSDTTATPAAVLGGYDFYDSAGVKTSGAIPTLASSSYTPGTSNQVITSGQYLGGNQTILGDANLVGSNILSGVSIFGVPGELLVSGGVEVTLGYISSGLFQPLTFSGTSAYDGGSAVNLSCYTYNLPVSSGSYTSSGVIISGVTSSITSGQNWGDTTVDSGGGLRIYSGGTATETTVYSLGALIVDTGGTANNTTVYGWMAVSYGTANNTTIKSSGSMAVSSGGEANGTVISGGGMRVSESGSATRTTLIGGDLYIHNGNNLIQCNGISANGHAYIFIQSNGSAANVAVSNNGYVEVGPSGGYLFSAIVGSGGHLVTEPGGDVIVQNVTVAAGGEVYIHPYTSASNITVLSGGTAIIDYNSYYSNIVSSAGAIVSFVSDPVG